MHGMTQVAVTTVFKPAVDNIERTGYDRGIACR